MTQQSSRRILLTGASGYVGGRLLHKLMEAGRPIRCLARHPEYLLDRVDPSVEVAGGDVLDRKSLIQALNNVHTAYYMVHSMGSSKDFEEMDRQAAENFAAAAAECGVQRIVYLGGLGQEGAGLSPHLRSRHEVGRILASAGVPVVELRASIVIGSGSLSFEMIRALVERLPVMITPRWVSARAQPIAIDDLLDYLVEALEVPADGSHVFEIGGSDQVSYGDLMKEYARQRGLRRLMIPVPLLTPYLSSLWLGLVTPIYARVGRKLVESLRHDTVMNDSRALEVFSVRPRGVQDCIELALRSEDQELAETRWFDALSSSGPEKRWAGVRFGNRLLDVREAISTLPPEKAFEPIQLIGGSTGWYFGNWLWRLRGFLDLLVGGVGMRRGRHHPRNIHVGDAIDWWRVEEFEPNRRLRLAAEMKVPGRAWLEFAVVPQDQGSLIRQSAVFDPVGLWGLVYWYLIFPIHGLVFRGMLAGIIRAAEDQAAKS